MGWKKQNHEIRNGYLILPVAAHAVLLEVVRFTVKGSVVTNMANVPNAGAAAGGGAGGEPPAQGLGLSDVLRMAIMFFVFQNLAGLAQQKGFLPSPKMPNPQENQAEMARQRFQQGRDDASGGIIKPVGASGRPSCMWSPGTTMDLHVYFSDAETLDLPKKYDFHASKPTKVKGTLAEWHEPNLKLYDGSDKRMLNMTVPLSEKIRYNSTHLYAHIRLARKSETDGDDTEGNVLAKTFKLSRHRLRKKLRDEKSLLGNDNEEPSVDNEADEADDPLSVASRNTTADQILLYVPPSMTLQVVDLSAMPQFPQRQGIPPAFGDHMDWLDDDSASFYPIVYRSEFWVTKTSFVAINGTTSEITLEATLEATSMWKWQIMSQMEESWKKQEDFMGDEDASGSDMFRTMLLETNPFLLAITGIVSLLHTCFDVLAFKNDIHFFKGRKSMEGLSMRTMIVNACFQVVILAYLADNETSMMVLASNAVGLAIEVWKISKAVSVTYEDGKVQWVETKEYTESKTKEYDEIATSHLLYVTMPLVTGFGVYSLMHQKHKGWYSWILNTLVGFIYMFGFVMMTPQLFINYKLQSVAHLNWKTMTYKSLGTFIDDLFAFVIKMPIMHRLACLRDDFIFLIFLYQRRIYKTDFSRVNEYGQCAQPTAEMLKELEKEKGKQQNDKKTGGNGTGGNGDEVDAFVSSPRGAIATGTDALRKRRGARDKR